MATTSSSVLVLSSTLAWRAILLCASRSMTFGSASNRIFRSALDDSSNQSSRACEIETTGSLMLKHLRFIGIHRHIIHISSRAMECARRFVFRITATEDGYSQNIRVTGFAHGRVTTSNFGSHAPSLLASRCRGSDGPPASDRSRRVAQRLPSWQWRLRWGVHWPSRPRTVDT